MKMDVICICRQQPQKNDNLLECLNESCENGKFFHLHCLNYKRRPNNSKTTWRCDKCKVHLTSKKLPGRNKLQQHSDMKSSTSMANCTSKNCNFEDILSDDSLESDELSDILLTHIGTGHTDKSGSLATLTDINFGIVLSPSE